MVEAGKQRQDVATRDFGEESGWWSLASAGSARVVEVAWILASRDPSHWT